MTDFPAPSRRDFLGFSALGFVGLATGASGVAWGNEPQATGVLLYVGTYTDGKRSDGIHLVRMDPRSGELRLVRSFDGGANPSFQHERPFGTA